MGRVYIPVLLFAAYHCAAQPRPGGDHIRASLPRGDLLRIAHRQQRLESMTARAERNVTVYVNNDLNTRGALHQAQERAAKMFAEAGVRIDWRIGRPSGAQPGREPVIVVSIAEHAPVANTPEALASAKVYEGVHITVFWDRVERLSRFAPPTFVLAHVLVHEITHILQGIDRHSEAGIIKSKWTLADFTEMASEPLPFTLLDMELIQRGIARRRMQGR